LPELVLYYALSSAQKHVMADHGAGQKLKVFISYSRKDSSDFADELVAGLELADFAPFLDRHDIAAGEDWEKRLGGLIAQADTVVFVLSPEAVKSEPVGWEVSETLRLSKRLLPVVYKSVPETDIPETLRKLQFVRFDTAQGVTRPLAELAKALRQDVEWIREHTRLGDLAARWEGQNRPEWLLLRGDDLRAAKAWIAKRKAEAPEITELQHSFIDVSEEADTETRARARRIQALMGAMGGVLMLMLSAFGAERYFNWRKGQSWGLLTDLSNGHVFELNGGSVSIGRSAGPIKNTIDVTDPQRIVSRSHLTVYRDRRAVDARSLNGTTVNARFLQYGTEWKLEDGDVIALAGAAAFEFRAIGPALLPWPRRSERTSSPPAAGTWALLIDGKSRQTIALTKDEYFLSADTQGAVHLNGEKDATPLLNMKKPTSADSDLSVANLAQDRFLTVMIRSVDASYFSVKMPAQHGTEAPRSLNEDLGKLPGGEYVSKVAFCFRRAEQPEDHMQMDPNDDVSCDVGPLQIVRQAQ
jgi:TIR domain-containing protein/FHA domain-containing protein